MSMLAEDEEAPGLSMLAEDLEAPGLLSLAEDEEPPGLLSLAEDEEAPLVWMDDVEAPSTSKGSISSIIQE